MILYLWTKSLHFCLFKNSHCLLNHIFYETLIERKNLRWKSLLIHIDSLLHHPLLTRCTNMACHTRLGMILSLNRKFEDEIVQFHSWGMNFNLRQKLRIKIGYFALIFDRILFSKSRLNSSVPNYNKGSKQTFGIHGAWYVQ